MGSAENPNPASWQSDPFGRHEQRWWDGEQWTEKVRSSGRTGIDPPGVVAKPEHARDHVPARPITDAKAPLRFTSRAVPRALVLATIVLIAIIVLVVIGIASA
ncbi:MAG: DUF2510 domain-containing protein [Acidimicrobiales bacterium]